MISIEEQYKRQKELEEIAAEQLEKFKACLALAGFKLRTHHLLVNGYHNWSREIWPPWYLFETDVGLIKVGWRKRVIHVGWESTGVLWIRPVDPDITRTDVFFHAWSYAKLVEYGALLYAALKEAPKR